MGMGETARRRLVVLDADSTLINDEVIELLADEAGTRDSVAEVTERAMRGEIDFAQSLRDRVATLTGLSPAALERVRARVTVTNGVPELIEAVHREGGQVCVVSGGFHEVLDPIAESLGIDLWLANRLERGADSTLTGAVVGDIVDARAKAVALQEWARAGDFTLADTVAIGDGANDLDMMSVAGMSIAFCAKPIVRERASHAIDTRDMRLAIDLIGL